MTHDEEFMRMCKVTPCDFSKFDLRQAEAPLEAGAEADAVRAPVHNALAEADAVPASVYHALAEAYTQLEAECAAAYPRARRVRAVYELVCAMAAIVAFVAIAVWIWFH